MVKKNSDSERGNPLPPHGLLFSISSKVLLYAPSHIHDNTYHGLCYTSCEALAGTRNISMGNTQTNKQINISQTFRSCSGC